MSPLLWGLLALFAARVAGQALVAFWDVGWLPPMQRWHSGLVPYELLLPAQIAILFLMAWICVDFTRGRGFFVRPRRFFAVYWLAFGWLYLGAMLLRLPIQLALKPQAPVIPIFFHWVLALFVLAVGLWHKRELARR